MNFFSNFAWAVPLAFSDALATCLFEEGDVLYDTPKAYRDDWSEAIKHISLSLQVRYPARATGVEKEDERSIIEKNWNSEVHFDLYDHQEKKENSNTDNARSFIYFFMKRGYFSFQ